MVPPIQQTAYGQRYTFLWIPVNFAALVLLPASTDTFASATGARYQVDQTLVDQSVWRFASLTVAHDIRHHFGHGWGVEQHIGIVGIGHGASTLFTLDTAAQRGHSLTTPEGGNVIVMIAHIADRFGADTTAPEVAVGRDVGTRPAGITGDHLVALVKHPFGQLIILGTEGLGKARDPLSRRLARLLAENVGDFVIVIGERGDAPTDRVQLDPFFGDFGDVAIRLQKF